MRESEVANMEMKITYEKQKLTFFMTRSCFK